MAIRQTPSPPAVAQSPSASLSNRRPSGRHTVASLAVDKAAASRVTQSLASARPALLFVLASIIGALLLLPSDPRRGALLFAPRITAAEDAPHEAQLAAALAELRRARGEGQAEEVVAAQEVVLARQQALLRRYRQQLTRISGQRGEALAGQIQEEGAGVGVGERGKAEVGGGEFVGTRHEGCGGGEWAPREPAVAEAERLEWRPQEGAYLLAACVYGRVTNRLLCLRNYVLAATLLRRTLIVPSADLYRPSRRWNSPLEAPLDLGVVFNASHLNACVGRPVAMSLDDHLRASNASRLVVDRFVCWADRCAFHRGRPSHPAIRFASRRQAGLEANVTRRTFVDAYGSAGGRVLCLGDIYESHARFLDPPPGFTSSLAIGWAMPPHAPPPDLQAGGGLAGGGGVQAEVAAMGVERRCRSLLWPCDAVVQAAEGFVREVSGTQFAALHLRRDDMYRHCVGQGKCKYWAQRQAGECVRHKLLGGVLDSVLAEQARQHAHAAWAGQGSASVFPGRPLLFLASDTPDEDLAVFLSALQGVPLQPEANTTSATTTTAATTAGISTPTAASLPGLDAPESVLVVRLPRLEGKMWAERLNREGLAAQAAAVAAVEKVVCAMSRLFLGTPGSTFSHHIMHLRLALRTASCHDGGFCRGLMDPELH
ncbi:hypothetical protein CLOM_g20270 [Closterium sp. NIES-68]|nr:hypothetical protein CLOM_g20270 [Closterium sp. NIES-68]GJP64361.1 hypothetical protein CLOP_g21365 [Closterium sp. NIES-67]